MTCVLPFSACGLPLKAVIFIDGSFSLIPNIRVLKGTGNHSMPVPIRHEALDESVFWQKKGLSSVVLLFALERHPVYAS
jgi:hypothetical protein